MAHMLGSEYCLESLQNDVTDLQTAVTDVTSRAGPIRYPSWKFPDKVSCDLDVPALLEVHRFSEDVEDNQVAHIVLFELVIDRMVLLLQGFTRYMEMLLSGSQGRPPTAGHVTGVQMSIGLVVKKFWNKMVQLNNLFQQLLTENKAKSQTLNKLEAINSELQLQTLRTSKKLNLDNTKKVGATNSSSLSLQNLDQKPSINSSNNSSVIATDTRTVASQTLETAFVPCEACALVQLGLKQVADTITDVCQSQGLQSAIAKHRKLDVTESTMTAADIARWSAQQTKDLDQIKKCLLDLLNQIHPLQSDLSTSKSECSELKKGLSEKSLELKKERDAREVQRKQHQAKLREVEKQHAESILIVHQNLEELKKGKKQNEEELSALKRELQKQCEARQVLEDINKRLTQEAEGNTSNHAAVIRLKSQVEELEKQLQSTSQELQDTSKQLGKEQARNRSVDKHGQSVQAKHEALVRRIDELDQECSDLRDSLAESEEAQDQLTEQLKDTQREVKGLKEELQKEKDLVVSIHEEKQFLERSISDLQTMIITLEGQLEDSHSRERMLVQYPDMNPRVIPQGPLPTGDGDNPSDMKQQVQSNNIRIQILEEQNNLLRKNIAKMLSQQETSPPIKASGPAIPLWQSSGLLAKDNLNNKTTAEQPRKHQQQLSSQKAPTLNLEDQIYLENRSTRKTVSADHHSTKHDKSKGGKRSSSSNSVNVYKLAAAGGNTSLNAYMKLKQSGAITPGVKTTGGPSEGKASSNSRSPVTRKQGWIQSEYNKPPNRPKDQYRPLNTFICPSCDKMYTSEHDLEIHQSYCSR